MDPARDDFRQFSMQATRSTIRGMSNIMQFHLFKQLRERDPKRGISDIAQVLSPALSADRQRDWAVQPKSLLLSLPAELRLQVFRAVLGDSIIHCFSLGKIKKGRTTAFFVCPQPSQCNCSFRIFPEDEEPYLLWLSAKVVPSGLTCPSCTLLRTCRQVYFEAIEALYNSNTFRLHDLWTVSDLRESLPLHRYNQIRSVSLSFSFGSTGFIPGSGARTWNVVGSAPVTHKLWHSTWAKFPAAFPHVKELEIVLEMRSLSKLLDADEEAWTAPFMNVRKMPLDRVRVRMSALAESPDFDRQDEVKDLERRLEELMMMRDE